MIDSALLSSLPPGTQAKGHVSCHLMEYSPTGEGAIAWTFLYNPERIETSKSARYASQSIDGNLPTVEYGGPDARTVRVNDVRLRGWFDGKDVGPLAEGLERLTKASEKNQVQNTEGEPGLAYSTPLILSFVMGGRAVIAPCVVTDTSRIETAWWNGGQIAEATVSFTLREVSKADLIF